MRAHSRVALGRPLLGHASVATLLSLLALLAAGTSSAQAGPGVVLKQGAGSEEIRISGAQIAGAANSGPTSYTDRERPGGPSTKITLRGITIRGLLGLAGIDGGSVNFVQVVGDDGSVLTLRGAEINGGGFPEGPAIVTDEGSTTRFFRPARSAGGTSENVPSAPGTPIEVTVDGGSLLSVRATASPRTVKIGQTVRFTASVSARPPGAQISYTWDFGDGTTGSGDSVTHTYSISGDLQASVKAQGRGGSSQCSSVCAGVKSVDVSVTGRERQPDQAQGTPQGGGTSSNFGGNGGTGGGTGTGDGGSGSGSGTGTQAAPNPSRNAPRPQRPEPDSRFSADPKSAAGQTIVRGILLSGSGVTIAGNLPEGKQGGTPKPAEGQSGTASQISQIAIAAAFAISVFVWGALQERRRVTLRIA
ncbi:MAG: PKD domain-containing protein [Solirubrobacteraceae bacterium]